MLFMQFVLNFRSLRKGQLQQSSPAQQLCKTLCKFSKLGKTLCKFQTESKHELTVRESFEATTSYRSCTTNILFMVTEIPGLNLLGRDAIKNLGITVDKFFCSRALAISSSLY